MSERAQWIRVYTDMLLVGLEPLAQCQRLVAEHLLTSDLIMIGWLPHKRHLGASAPWNFRLCIWWDPITCIISTCRKSQRAYLMSL
jgi:hypothetical protein